MTVKMLSSKPTSHSTTISQFVRVRFEDEKMYLGDLFDVPRMVTKVLRSV